MDEDTVNKFKASIDRQFDALKDQQTIRKQAHEKQRKQGTDGGDYMFTLPMPYQPEFASPERVQYPIDRAQQNRYWRLFYKLDPVISNVVDLFGDIISSEFSIEGEGVEGEVKDTYETMTANTKVISLFPYFIREFLVMGEVFPHLIFDKDKGMWTGLIFHNPDQIKVIDSPFIEMEPLVEFVPDASLKALINSKNPQIQKYISNLPAEVTQAISSRRNITLDTSLNVTFIARKLHPYDVRGTSILTRLYRILMYEDAIANACFTNKINVLGADYSSKPLSEYSVGDKVIDKDGQVQTVEAVWSEEPKGDLVKIVLQGGIVLECTQNHKFPVFAYPRVCGCGCGGAVKNRKSFIATHIRGNTERTIIDWVSYGSNNTERWAKRRLPSDYDPYQTLEAKDLKKYDYLMIPRKFEECEPSKVNGLNVNDSMARLLGYYIANGYKLKLYKDEYKGIRWCFHIDKHDTWIKDIEDSVSQLGISSNVYIQEDTNSCTIDFVKYEYSWLSAWFLNNGGEYAKGKQFSMEVMQWPLELKKEVIKGCFRGDGSYSKGKSGGWQISYTSVSYTLISQLRIILNQLGIFSGYSRRINNGKAKGILHKLYITGKKAQELIKLVWNEDVETVFKSDEATWIDEDYIYVPVKKVESFKTDEKVYNLTVSGSHSYLAEGIGTFNSIATARRHAGPLKIVKLGDKELNWVPEKEYEDKILQLLSIAEQDPHAVLVVPWFVQFEAFGTTDRMLTIRNEWDVIERIKLTALGVSQGFLHGEATYSSMKGNMQTLFMKLRGLRTFFETLWWYPKFFKPVAEMNEFIKPSQAEVSHRLRFRRSKKELLEDNRYIIPKIRWSRALDPKVDAELLDAYEQLMNRLKLPIAAGTAYSAVGLDFEAQVTQQIVEKKKEAELRRTLGAPKEEEETPTETPLEEAIEEEVVEELESAPEEAEASKQSKFNINEIYDLDNLLKTGEAGEDIWRDMMDKPKKDKKNNGKNKEQKLEITKSFTWDDVEEYLDDRGYTNDEIVDLKKAVRKLNMDKEFFIGEGNKGHV